MLLIGLAGRARSGKDTAAAYLAERYGLVSMAFAAPIKEMVGVLLGVPAQALDGVLKEEPLEGLGVSPRALYQTLGTEWGRELVHPDLWQWVAERRLLMLELAGGTRYAGVVFSDVRFPNEAAWIRARGGTVVHIVRPEAPAVRAHVSELGLEVEPGDLVVRNDDTLETLHARLDGVMALLRERREATA